MATVNPMSPNESHEPKPSEERVLQVFKRERELRGESRMSPSLIRDRLDEERSKQNVNYALDHLTTAGWINKIAPGLYEFVDDPREEDP